MHSEYTKLVEEFVTKGEYSDGKHAPYFMEMTDDPDSLQYWRLVKGWLWWLLPVTAWPALCSIVMLPIIMCCCR